MQENGDTGKKKPGRPKKKAVVVQVETHGVVDKPVNDDDLLELVYCNPILFKRIMRLFRSFEVSEIELLFRPADVKIIAIDHFGKSTIYATIDGKCMNLYYCKMPMRVCITRDNLDRVLSNLTRNHYKLTLILKENYRSIMYMIVKDVEYDNDDSYEIDVIFKPDGVENINRDDDTNYPVKFKVTSKHFKQRMTSIRALSKTFTIQKCGNDPLQLTFDKAQKVNWTGIYNDPAKIDLKCTLGPDDIFNVSVCVDNIKPFSNSDIGEFVHIAADKREKMSFTTMLDKKDNGYAATIKVFTEIKDYHRAQIHE